MSAEEPHPGVPMHFVAADSALTEQYQARFYCFSDPGTAAMHESADVVVAKSLLDLAKNRGFTFCRIAPGPDGPLWGVRESLEWVDELFLGGFWARDSCSATRRRRSSLVVPGGLPLAQQLRGDALTVLHTVLWDWGT